MRISDWSSDVCSSDLEKKGLAPTERKARVRKWVGAGANALGGECPPAPAFGRRLPLDFAPKDIRTRVPACTVARKRKSVEHRAEPAKRIPPDVRTVRGLLTFTCGGNASRGSALRFFHGGPHPQTTSASTHVSPTPCPAYT